MVSLSRSIPYGDELNLETRKEIEIRGKKRTKKNQDPMMYIYKIKKGNEPLSP
jgi:hypothetical protein